MFLAFVSVVFTQKNKTKQDTQKNCAKATQDLNKMRSNYSELEATLGKLKTNLELNADTQNKDRTRIQDLSEEVEIICYI